MKRITSAVSVLLMFVLGASALQAQADSNTAAVNIAGEWTYGDGHGKATIQQVGTSVSYQGVWLPSNHRYELNGQVEGKFMNGDWTLLGTSEKGTAKFEIAADAASMRVVHATGGRGWLDSVFIRQQQSPPAGSEVKKFDGSNFIESNKLPPEAYKELTIELWVKRGARNEGIILFHSGVDRKYPGVRADGSLSWAAGGGPNYPNGMKANLPLRQDTWVHLAFVKNAPANQMLVYVNGVEKAKGQGGTGRDAHNADTPFGIFRLGHSLPTTQNGWSPSWMAKHGFQGEVAEVRIWRVVRTPEQIFNDMKVRTDQLPSKDGLLLYGPKNGELTPPAP